jgi:ATP-dependent Clp protease ATP-binding subunit ClpX
MFEKNKKKIESGVIVIDEFDKIKASSEQNGRDASGLGVQKSLLKLLEGKICQMKDGTQIDTSKMTFVLLGAFKELRNERDKRLNSYNIKSQISIGFIQEETEPIIKQNKSFIIEDFEKSGYMTEVIGRVRTIIEGNELGEDDFLDILKNSKLSNFNGIKEELLEYNVKLEIKQGTFEKIAQIAFDYKSGARAINKVLDEMFSNILYDILSNEDKYSKCIISPETVEDNQDYILE